MKNLENTELKIINGAYNKKADGIYVGDILSYALTKLKKGNIWITSQTNVNVIAIAFSKKISCVILPDGLTLNEDAFLKAKEHNINVISSKEDAYSVAVLLHKIYGGHNE